MDDIQLDDVRQLVADILRAQVIDEDDLRRECQPFMRAVIEDGLGWSVPPPAIIETYRAARRAVDRLASDRSRCLRAPAKAWPLAEFEALDDSEVLRALFPK
jgi:hypothetical protein